MPVMSSLSPRRLVLAAVLAAGCGEPSDACIALSEEDIVLTAYLTDTGSRARAEVELVRVSGDERSIPLRLCDRNQLFIDGARTTRVRRPSGSSVYRADIKKIADVATTHTFVLRDDRDEVEYTATVDAPAFEITAPAAGVSLSRTSSWDLAWTPARPGATMTVVVDDVIDGETCLGAPIELALPDEGAAQIISGELKVSEEGLAAVDQCAATIRLARTTEAALEPRRGDARLHPDSRVEAATSRELLFTSVP